MNDEIKEILDRIETASEIFDCLLKPEECTELLDYITNLQAELQEANDNAEWWHNRFKAVQQENERLKENNQSMQEEMARVWEENERLKEELFKSVNNTNKSIELTEDYKSRCEKINEILKESPDFNYSNDYIILKRRIESVLQNGGDTQ